VDAEQPVERRADGQQQRQIALELRHPVGKHVASKRSRKPRWNAKQTMSASTRRWRCSASARRGAARSTHGRHYR
jgi:hypothetical protein